MIQDHRIERYSQLNGIGLVYSPRDNAFVKDDIQVPLVDITCDTDTKFAATLTKIKNELERRKTKMKVRDLK